MGYTRLAWFLALCIITTACSSDDPTFMGVCQVGDRVLLPIADEVNSRACEAPMPIVWPQMPLVVDADPDILDSYEGSLDEAISFWNDELGFQAFTRTGPLAQVHVVIGDASAGANGAAGFTFEDGRMVALVELRQPADITSVYYILAHELGHALGLCHDPDNSLSIMYPELDYTWDMVDESGQPVDFRPIAVTGNDRSALRKQYL